MFLRLITGRAGSGKTSCCLREICAELHKDPLGAPLILLVPEQASFQTENALARAAGTGGYMRAQVLGFRRLAYRVLQETGGVTRAPVGEMGKRMIIRRLLERRAGELRIFGRAADLPGFVDKLARALGEMKTYRVAPLDLQFCLEELQRAGESGLLEDKLRDLQAVFTGLTEFLQGRFVDPDDYLTLAAEKIKSSTWLCKARVWVDGFTGFTPQEYAVLLELMRHTGGVNVTLCLGRDLAGKILSETDPFYPVWETYTELLQMAGQERLPVYRSPVSDDDVPRRFNAPDLAYLEKYLFNHRAAAGPAGEGISIMAAADRRAEVEGLAREITRLCRDRGYRWRDVVVLLRDVELYADLIDAVFTDHDIPFFLDRKRAVMHHPLVELLRAALEVVIEDWSFDPVFRCLKTDLFPVSREEVDLLENYVLAHGIRGSRWIDGKPWEYRRRLTLEEDSAASDEEMRELEQINSIRAAAAAALAGLHQRLRESGTVKEYTVALYGLLEELAVPEKLERWSELAREEGRLEAAREHAQVWEAVVALLDELVEALGEEELSLRQYARILEAGLAAIRLGLIPPGLDQVVVGSLDRSRSPEVRAAFIPGVNEGVLPARVFEQGIFTEAEREQLQLSGLRLAPGVRRRVFDEQYVVYTAVTRAGERLVLSYPLADEEGRALKPSPVLHRVRELFPELVEGFWPQEPGLPGENSLEFITHPGRCLTHLAGRLRDAAAGREIDPVWWEVYNWFVRENNSPLFDRVVDSLFFSNREGRLPRDISRRLYGRPLSTSVSGLEKFRSCPYAHFLARGLRLRERAVHRLAAPDTGQFLHAALKLFAEHLQERGLDWGRLGRSQCRELAGEVVDLLAPRLQSEILLSSARYRYLTGKLKRIVQRSALVLAEHAKRGSFRPVGLELAFGREDDPLPGVVFTLADGSEMVLTGRIDRIDAVEHDGEIYLRVIDYKSGTASLKLSDVWHGLKLQLLTYLEVALRYSRELVNAEGLPGAVLYFRIDEPLVKTEGGVPADEEIERQVLKELKMKGLVLADPDLVRKMDGRAGAASDLLPVGFKKDGGFSARSTVLDREQFNLLRAYLRRQLAGAGSEIMAGVKDISPYRQGNFRYCSHCRFKAVCRFDPLLPENVFRVIAPEKDADIWRRIKEQLGVGDDD